MSARSAARRSGDAAAVARELLDEMTVTSTGQSSVSVYETGRLVSLSPWLTLHVERIRYLVEQVRADGAWGAPGWYALVPTLSAADGLLAALRRDDLAGAAEPLRARAVHVVDRALAVLYDWLTAAVEPCLPDMPAADLIVPALVESLTAHLTAMRDAPVAGLERWAGTSMPLPAGMSDVRLDRVRAALASRSPLPEKLLHALEVAGPAAHRAAGVVPVGPGTVGASPAATAAWLGVPDAAGRQARAYLEGVARHHGGPVPCTSPITVLERSWALSTLARAGVPLVVPPTLLAELTASVGPRGAATAPGLPVDADTTSVTLYALARIGHPADASGLWSFDTGEHFCTWPGEDGASITTNAHALDALGWYLGHRGPDQGRLAATVRRLTRWLVDRQEADGRWCSDRWHASPYYATCCTVLALHAYGVAPTAAEAVDRAVRWVLGEQRPDGSWGRWGGTVEETAYALQVLLSTGARQSGECVVAITRGLGWIATMEGADGEPALWHDKDLYRPSQVVRAAVLAVRWLGAQVATGDGEGVDIPAPDAMIRIA